MFIFIQGEDTLNTFTATYSPEDNKLRLYASERLDDELYQKAVRVGFKWAPKQQLFFAPMWTPQRRDFLLSLCDEIDDEQLTAEERASERAARFETYHDKRLKDASQHGEQAQALADQVPMGQPILVGHHSEKRARKHAEKIDRAMSKSVKFWDQAEYWKARAERVSSHLAYKERPDVRLRRIKKLESEARKFKRYIVQAEKFKDLWASIKLDKDNALKIANYDNTTWDSKDRQSVYSALDKDQITPQQAKEKCTAKHERIIKHYGEWFNHNTFRIDYEKQMLIAQGHNPEPVKKVRPKLPPIVNYDSEGMIAITKKQWSEINKDYKSSRIVPATKDHAAYRQRKAMHVDKQNPHSLSYVFITDQKIVEIPLND